MASRRKKKRNRQFQEYNQLQPQDGSMPDQDFDDDIDYSNDYTDSSDRYEASYETSLQEQRESSDTAEVTSPPPLPKHDQLSGPHIKFPANAQRKSSSAKEDSDKSTEEARPNLLRFWRKKNPSPDDGGVAMKTKPSKPVKPSKKKRSKDSLKGPTKTFTDQLEEEAKEVDDPFAPKKKRRLRSRLLWMFLLSLVLIWALPWIVTKTPLLGVVIAQATGDLNGSVEVESVSCGWFSSFSVAGLNVKDREGNTVLEVPNAEGDRSLLGLLLNLSDLGTLKIDKPTVHVVFGPEGSTNVEELIAAYLEGPSGDPFDLEVQVTDAKVMLAAAPSVTPKKKELLKPLVTLTGVDVSLTMVADPDAAESMVAEVSGSVEAGTKAEGEKPVAEKLPTSPTSDDFNAKLVLGRQNQLLVSANHLVLDHFSPLLTKVASGLELQGSMNGRVDCRWGEIATDGKNDAAKEKTAAKEDLLVEANVQLNQFTATGGPFGTDRLQLAQPNLTCKLSGNNGVYVLKQVGLDSEVATVALDGQVVLDTGMFTGEGAGGSGAIANQTFKLSGRVDLARLANMLPTTLHLHDQTTVNSGELTLNVSAVPGENVAPLASGRPPIVWNAEVQTLNIVAMRYGSQFAWPQPIRLTLRAHEADRVNVVIDELLCTSDFLRVKAEGHREEFTIGANFDLGQLMTKLGAIVDLGGLQMQGKGLANLNWNRVENQDTTLLASATPGVKEGFTLHSACRIQGLEIGMAQASIQDLVPVGNPVTPVSNTLFKRPWTEPFVIVTLSAAGRMPAKGPISLAGGDVRITSNAEQIVATLTKPVAEVSTETVWPIRIDAQGQLGRWVDRAHAMGYATDWRSQGEYNARIIGSYRTEAMKFEDVSIQANNFHLLGPDLNINEPQVNLNLSGYYDRTKARLLITQADCQMSAAKLTAENFIYGTPENQPMELAGTLGIEGDLARMQAWLTGERNWFYQGHLKGIANLKQVKDATTGRIEANVQHLVVSQKNGYKFYEPDLIVTADGSYNGTSRLIELTDAQITSSVLNGQMKGNVLTANDPIETDLVGSIDYNMKRLSALVVPFLGPNVQFQGNSKSPLKLQGPMTLAQMHAETGIGWDSASVYGFDLDKGQLDFQLDKGLLSTAPIQMKVNEGQVNLAPQLRVAPGEMQLEVPAGTIVDNVQINKQMCENGLKYIAPVLADVAQADGRFSLAISQCRIPIDHPDKGQLTGQLTIHDMAISSGPLIQQFGAVLQRMTSAKLQKESIIPFKMVNGKIYHENLELVFPEITIKTRGYVGLDQSMDLIAEMPVPQKWINRTGGSIKPALRGQKVGLRIGGTLSKPQLNQRAMQQEMQRFIGNAAANVIEKEGRKFIDEQLNRLFQPTR